MGTDNTLGGVRLATENDVGAIALLAQKCFSDPWSENSFRSCMKENTEIFVLEGDGLICGFAVFDRTLGAEAELHVIAVEPDLRGRGLSKLLMDALIDSARRNGVGRVMLEVRASNEPAIALYAKYGFEKVGVRPAYYRNPTENAILMDLLLS